MMTKSCHRERCIPMCYSSQPIQARPALLQPISLIFAAALAVVLLSGCATMHGDNDSGSSEPWAYKPLRSLGELIGKAAPF